ncbi:MAG: type 1 glutamine amidotransferase domain-containing protein [Lentisphaeria bacterium]|nr:type 1 glutamine amidotransferase domain-containing protein [Lentisphaeria bacterium]
MNRGKVLFVVTSHDRMGVLRSRKTGVWLEDFAVVHDILSEAGYEVRSASPRGGEIPVDPDSMRYTAHAVFNPEAWLERKKDLLLESIPLDEICHDEFDAVYYPGGYGSFWDLSVSGINAELLEGFVRAEKTVAAIRHGGAALLSAKTPAGQSILNGRRVTGASDDEERQMALDRVVPFSLGNRLARCGAEYICTEPWKPHVVADGKLLTGQNTQSAGKLARTMLSVMERPADGSCDG